MEAFYPKGLVGAEWLLSAGARQETARLAKTGIWNPELSSALMHLAQRTTPPPQPEPSETWKRAVFDQRQDTLRAVSMDPGQMVQIVAGRPCIVPRWNGCFRIRVYKLDSPVVRVAATASGPLWDTSAYPRASETFPVPLHHPRDGEPRNRNHAHRRVLGTVRPVLLAGSKCQRAAEVPCCSVLVFHVEGREG